MPLVLSPEMRRQFHQVGQLEVEALLHVKQLEAIRSSLKTLFPSSSISFWDKYLRGHDLFRTVEPIRRVVLKKDIIRFGAELVQSRSLHVGLDQLFDWTSPKGKNWEQESSFQKLFSITPLVLGVLICLEGIDLAAKPPFPSLPGNATFFFPELPMDWKIETPFGRSFLFIGFAPAGATYKINPIDPHTHLLKKLDYVEGSTLGPRAHPFFRF